MTIIIEIYMITCTALLLFNIAFLVVKNKSTRALYPKDASFEADIRSGLLYLEARGALPEELCRSLPHRLRHTRDLITLINMIRDDDRARKAFSPCIFALIKDYAKKKPAEQAYYAYAVSLLDYDEESMPQGFTGTFMEFLGSKSLYVFSNTMNALYHFGQPYLLTQALDELDARGPFYHKKLLVDGLLDSRADPQVFVPMVLEHFHRYGPYLRECLLDYFRMSGWDAGELCMETMADPKEDPQVRYTAMRYFSKFPCPASDDFFLHVLLSPGRPWLDQMLAIQGLAQNTSPQVRRAVKDKITSPNWYVRLNAAGYLEKHGLTQEEICEIISKRDRYSAEILRYCCRADEDLVRGINEALRLMEAEEQAGPEPAAAYAGPS